MIKNVFWQALILTIIVFIVGIFLGITYEGNKLDEINDYYVSSDIFLMDSFALSKLTDIVNTASVNCSVLVNKNIEFADKIYNEAYILEKYEESGKLSETLKVMHRKYDLLRTLLWINFMSIPDKCKKNTSMIIYLYEYQTEDLTKKATNKVWSKILLDLKEEKGSEVILIPIAVDSNLTSLDALLDKFEISSFPTVIINEKEVISELSSVDDLKMYLN